MKRIMGVLCIILVLLIWPVDSRKCYECGCEYDWETNTGTCSSPDFSANCPLNEVGDRYCFMISSYNDNYENRIFEAITSNNLQDSHFIQAVETISLSSTVWLPTAISSIGYGCDWDGCNNVSLANYLPESFQININQTILSNELLDGQLPAKACYSCSKCINELTAILCKQVSCPNGICYIDEIHNYVTTAANNCTFHFYSLCESFTDPVQSPSVRIRATYYIDFPVEKQLEIDEVDIRCTKDYCNSIQVVEFLKGQVQTTINLHSDFRPSRVTTTTTFSTGSSSSSSSTNPPTTTANSGPNSARLYPLGIFYMIFTFLLLQ
ncbi:hypothetical protein I4U23_030655 [Adineta vaga]|nr:hypothetical protein I4U23_030655 [Adineta vaga]